REVTETRDLSNAVNMAGPVEARFDAAVNVVRSMPKKGINNLFESKPLFVYCLCIQVKITMILIVCIKLKKIHILHLFGSGSFLLSGMWVSLLLIFFQFYAFYKQAKEGECCESKPGFWDVVKKAKWSEFADIT
ncbi:unnamed protein product, partial [Porites evermanni]